MAMLNVLDSPIKQEIMQANLKMIRRVQSKDQKRKSLEPYLKTGEGAQKQSDLKNNAKSNLKVKLSNKDNVKNALESCLKTVEVAKNQLKEDLIVQLKKLYHLELEHYEAHSLEFLKIPKSDDIWCLVDHLKRYYVVVKQMEKESEDEYRDSVKNTTNQISQLEETLELTAMLITRKISPKKGYPILPDGLKTESSRSMRQNRDYLFVKHYKSMLEKVNGIIEELLKTKHPI